MIGRPTNGVGRTNSRRLTGRASTANTDLVRRKVAELSGISIGACFASRHRATNDCWTLSPAFTFVASLSFASGTLLSTLSLQLVTTMLNWTELLIIIHNVAHLLINSSIPGIHVAFQYLSAFCTINLVALRRRRPGRQSTLAPFPGELNNVRDCVIILVTNAASCCMSGGEQTSDTDDSQEKMQKIEHNSTNLKR